ncbi:MAG: hypothetical protein ACLQVY_02080 [Limisphaerales bacterium]
MNGIAKIYKPGLVGLAALLFCVASLMQNRLNTARADLGMTRLTPLENAPPVLAFTTVALGGFRGLIVNALWIRANDLQDQDKFFDMVQLVDWITKLEPHFVDVWKVEAWNMAYNISVKFKDPEDRWHWVERGIELLRDNALKWNPAETGLYRDLSWIFQHKMGAYLDDAHMTYKFHWAQEMQDVLGGHPNFAALENPQTPAEKERARKLREVYKMDPAIIEKVDKDYGPLDWRLPDAHAVYWAELARLKAKPKEQETVRRSIYQSLQQACLWGALDRSVTNVTPDNFSLLPNLDVVPKVDAGFEEMIAATDEPGMKDNVKNGHKNFLKTVVPLLYEDNRMEDAARWFEKLKATYTNAFVGKMANISLEDYALGQIVENYDEMDPKKVNAAILSFCHREFVCLVLGQDDKAVNYQHLAFSIWSRYSEKMYDAAQKQRLGLKPFAQLRQEVLDKEFDPLHPRMNPYAQAILRTKLNMPAAKPPPAPAAPSVETSSSDNPLPKS